MTELKVFISTFPLSHATVARAGTAVVLMNLRFRELRVRGSNASVALSVDDKTAQETGLQMDVQQLGRIHGHSQGGVRASRHGAVHLLGAQRLNPCCLSLYAWDRVSSSVLFMCTDIRKVSRPNTVVGGWERCSKCCCEVLTWGPHSSELVRSGQKELCLINKKEIPKGGGEVASAMKCASCSCREPASCPAHWGRPAKSLLYGLAQSCRYIQRYLKLEPAVRLF